MYSLSFIGRGVGLFNPTLNSSAPVNACRRDMFQQNCTRCGGGHHVFPDTQQVDLQQAKADLLQIFRNLNPEELMRGQDRQKTGNVGDKTGSVFGKTKSDNCPTTSRMGLLEKCSSFGPGGPIGGQVIWRTRNTGVESGTPLKQTEVKTSQVELPAAKQEETVRDLENALVQHDCFTLREMPCLLSMQQDHPSATTSRTLNVEATNTSQTSKTQNQKDEEGSPTRWEQNVVFQSHKKAKHWSTQAPQTGSSCVSLFEPCGWIKRQTCMFYRYVEAAFHDIMTKTGHVMYLFHTRLASGFNTVRRILSALSNLVQTKKPALTYKSQTNAEEVSSSSSELRGNSGQLEDQQTAAETRNQRDELQQQIYRPTVIKKSNLEQKKLVNKSLATLVFIALCPDQPQSAGNNNQQRSKGPVKTEPQNRHLTDQILTWPGRLFIYAGSTIGRTCRRMSAFLHQTTVAAFQTTRTRTLGFVNAAQARIRETFRKYFARLVNVLLEVLRILCHSYFIMFIIKCLLISGMMTLTEYVLSQIICNDVLLNFLIHTLFWLINTVHSNLLKL
ncbi:hypothetical protein ATANTOWER_021316 [Ataeniobius toweri]|uniref:Uncharacterized protein n=1 Tax=Ataeniobius toweri TaxID=208326 RepID=A0ABU7B063_9TELE|nr:hypothetical protein [Ataeniobius toweri]